jgi:hypothetical protein
MPSTHRTLADGARFVRLRRGVGAAIAALITAAFLGACGSSSSSSSTGAAKANLNTKRVARSIEQSILTQRHLRYTVTCPAAVPQEQGRTFECVATGLNAKHKLATTHFVVTVQNSRGYVTYVGK